MTKYGLKKQMEKVSQGQQTYGHALYEFCLFRERARYFVQVLLPKMSINGGLDVFKTASDALNRSNMTGRSKIAHSDMFYHELEQNK